MRVKGLGLLLPVLGLLAAGCNPKLEVETPVVKEDVAMADGLTQEEIANAKLTPEVLWKMGRLGTIALSPDGAQVL